MKKPRIDMVILILAVLLLAAMALTLLRGRGGSRHGYGQTGTHRPALIAQHGLKEAPAVPGSHG